MQDGQPMFSGLLHLAGVSVADLSSPDLLLVHFPAAILINDDRGEQVWDIEIGRGGARLIYRLEQLAVVSLGPASIN